MHASVGVAYYTEWGTVCQLRRYKNRGYLEAEATRDTRDSKAKQRDTATKAQQRATEAAKIRTKRKEEVATKEEDAAKEEDRSAPQ